jgi:proteasome lid subunit RPN8/RPN11
LSIPLAAEIQIRQADLETMRRTVEEAAPEEACGMLAGTIVNAPAGNIYRAELVIPTTNMLHSPVRYQVEPLEQLRAFERMEAAGLELVSIYHSHPRGPSYPSPTDLDEAYYPDAVYLIWSGESGEWLCQGFQLLDRQAIPVNIRLLP